MPDEKIPNIYKALAQKELLKKRATLRKSIPNQQQRQLFFRAYQILDEMDRDIVRKGGKSAPIMPPGISQLVWDSFPVQFRSGLNVQGQFCSSTMFSFFRQLYLALNQAEDEVLEKK